jgi:hypothetical protein
VAGVATLRGRTSAVKEACGARSPPLDRTVLDSSRPTASQTSPLRAADYSYQLISTSSRAAVKSLSIAHTVRACAPNSNDAWAFAPPVAARAHAAAMPGLRFWAYAAASAALTYGVVQHACECAAVEPS